MKTFYTAPLLSIALLLMAFSTIRRMPDSGIEILYPQTRHVVMRDNMLHVVLTADVNTVGKVRVYAVFDTTFSLNLPSLVKRHSLATEFTESLPANLILQSIRFISTPWHLRPDTASDAFLFSNRVNAREFFAGDTSHSANRAYYQKTAQYGTFHLTGWIPVDVAPTGDRTVNCKDNTIAVTNFLVPGMNVVPIEVYSEAGVLVATDSVLAWYATELDGGNSPEGFDVQAFHTSQQKSLCLKCHAASAGSNASMLCESCHGAFTRQHSVHTPVAGGDCTGCHEDRGGGGIAVLYDADSESGTCFKCHEGIGNAMKNQNPHAALMDGHCSKCHSPHASPVDGHLRTRVDEVCFTCHAEKADGNHPIVFHPVGNKPDPKNPGRELTCVSCHDPHVSENKNLLRYPGGAYSICQKCHSK